MFLGSVIDEKLEGNKESLCILSIEIWYLFLTILYMSVSGKAARYWEEVPYTRKAIITNRKTKSRNPMFRCKQITKVKWTQTDAFLTSHTLRQSCRRKNRTWGNKQKSQKTMVSCYIM